MTLLATFPRGSQSFNIQLCIYCAGTGDTRNFCDDVPRLFYCSDRFDTKKIASQIRVFLVKFCIILPFRNLMSGFIRKKFIILDYVNHFRDIVIRIAVNVVAKNNNFFMREI